MFAQTLSATKSAENLSAPGHQVRENYLDIRWEKNLKKHYIRKNKLGSWTSGETKLKETYIRKENLTFWTSQSWNTAENSRRRKNTWFVRKRLQWSHDNVRWFDKSPPWVSKSRWRMDWTKKWHSVRLAQLIMIILWR